MATLKSISPLLLVVDLDRSIAFYTRELGFRIDFRYEDFYAGLIQDGCTIHLKCGKPNKQERENRKANEDVDLIFSVDHIRELYEVMITKPVTIIQPLREMPYGQEFYISDPDDYLIAFIA
jgi:catechol 2,3-dioxygenase-like lactoylglutathione lyase family enzyme